MCLDAFFSNKITQDIVATVITFGRNRSRAPSFTACTKSSRENSLPLASIRFFNASSKYTTITTPV